MSVAVIIDMPGGRQKEYEQVIASVFPEGKLPKGWQVHLAGPTDKGWRIVNVVPSQEEFETFARDRLRPALEQAGEGDITPQVTYFQVHRLIRS